MSETPQNRQNGQNGHPKCPRNVRFFGLSISIHASQAPNSSGYVSGKYTRVMRDRTNGQRAGGINLPRFARRRTKNENPAEIRRLSSSGTRIRASSAHMMESHHAR